MSWEWLSEVPKGWQLLPLRRVAALRNIRVVGSSRDEGYVGLENIEPWTGRLLKSSSTDSPLVDEENEDERGGVVSSFEAGDVLFGKLRPYLAKAYLAQANGVCTTELLVLRPVHIEARFLIWALLTKEFITQVDTGAFGARMPRAEWKTIGNLPVPVPPLSQQSAIADYLDRETGQIDALIAAKERLLLLLTEKRRAMISLAVTGGVNPDGSLANSGMQRVDKIPEKWAIVPLKRVSEIQYGLSQPPPYHDEGIPFLRATNVQQGKIIPQGLVFVKEDELPTSRVVRLRRGDIIVVRSGAYAGDSAIIPLEWEDSVAGYDLVVRLNSRCLPMFAAYSLMASYVLDHQIYPLRLRAAQPHLNAEELGNVLFLCPPLEVQEAIVSFLDRKLETMDKLVAATSLTLGLLHERRGALITAVVSGSRKVSEVS